MNLPHESNKSGEGECTTPDAKMARRIIPIWLLILLLLLLYYSMVYFDVHGGWFHEEVYTPYNSVAEVANYQPVHEGCDLVRGSAVFETICGLCHNNDGAGKPGQAPSLVSSEWVLGSPNRLVRIPLVGLSGPIKVKGEQVFFASGMAAMGAALSDDDLANVLCYIRQAWGNKAAPVTPEQVKAVRTELGSRSTPITEAELLGLPEK